MSQNPQHHHAHAPAGRPQRITDADESRSADMHSRTVKYTVSMSVRLACFIAAFFVHGWLQVVMLVLAVILPYFAVIMANASGTNLDKRSASNYYDHEPPAALTGGAGTDDAGRGPGPDAATAADDDATGPGTDPAGGTPAASGEGAPPDVLPGEWYTPDAPDTQEDQQGKDHHRG